MDMNPMAVFLFAFFYHIKMLKNLPVIHKDFGDE